MSPGNAVPQPPFPPQSPAGRPPSAARGRNASSPLLKLIAGLSVVGMATTFAAVVWLAYVEGGSSARGEPPLVKAIPEPMKVAADTGLEVGSGGVAVDDLLNADGSTGDEELRPAPEEPILQEAEEPVPENVDQASGEAAQQRPVPDYDQQLAALTSQANRLAQQAEQTTEQATEQAAPPSPAADPAEPVTPRAAEPPAREAPPTPAAELSPETSGTQVQEPAAAPTRAPAALAPPPSRPTPTPATASEPQQAAPARRVPSRLARAEPEEPARPSTPSISPSGIEQSGASGSGSGQSRLQLEPPPPVLARAPANQPTPAPSGTPSVVTAPGDDGRGAQQPIYRIQLASVRDEADARRAWELYRLDLGAVLSGLPPVIERADIANGTFYRVQAGAFADRLQAEAVCDQLKQRNTACLVVRR